jgi:hypothetical protein
MNVRKAGKVVVAVESEKLTMSDEFEQLQWPWRGLHCGRCGQHRAGGSGQSLRGSRPTSQRARGYKETPRRTHAHSRRLAPTSTADRLSEARLMPKR